MICDFIQALQKQVRCAQSLNPWPWTKCRYFNGFQLTSQSVWRVKISCSVGWSIDWLIDCLIWRSFDCVTSRLIDWLDSHFIKSLVLWLVGWLVDWLIFRSRKSEQKRNVPGARRWKSKKKRLIVRRKRSVWADWQRKRPRRSSWETMPRRNRSTRRKRKSSPVQNRHSVMIYRQRPLHRRRRPLRTETHRRVISMFRPQIWTSSRDTPIEARTFIVTTIRRGTDDSTIRRLWLLAVP